MNTIFVVLLIIIILLLAILPYFVECFNTDCYAIIFTIFVILLLFSIRSSVAQFILVGLFIILFDSIVLINPVNRVEFFVILIALASVYFIGCDLIDLF